MNEYQGIIGNTYLNQNYFNVGIMASNDLGEQGDNLSIILPNGLIIPTTIDRIINENGSVRFYGGIAWHEFIIANYFLGDTITFQVNNPNTITIIANAQ
jgi:hypothetical protein